MPCQRCGGAIVDARETLPYVGPHEYVVDLRDVRSLRCSACGRSSLQVPALEALDS
jgi:hypothetical protein